VHGVQSERTQFSELREKLVKFKVVVRFREKV